MKVWNPFESVFGPITHRKDLCRSWMLNPNISSKLKLIDKILCGPSEASKIEGMDLISEILVTSSKILGNSILSLVTQVAARCAVVL